MKLYDFEVVDRCLFWKKKKILIVGDLHLGYEDNLISKGVGLPMSQFEESLEIFKRIFGKTGKVKKIILLGDVKHNFGKIMKQEFDDFRALILFFYNNLESKGEIVITKGNHDSILDSMVKNCPKIKLVDGFFLDGKLLFHGDSKSLKQNYARLDDKKVDLVILGHFHPAYILKDKESIKKEKFKCFLYGFSPEYRKKVVFVPSFFPLIEGSDIIEELEIYKKGMRIALITNTGRVYDFRKLKTLK